MEQFCHVCSGRYTLYASVTTKRPTQRVKFTTCEFLENGETQNGIKAVTNDCNCIKSE